MGVLEGISFDFRHLDFICFILQGMLWIKIKLARLYINVLLLEGISQHFFDAFKVILVVKPIVRMSCKISHYGHWLILSLFVVSKNRLDSKESSGKIVSFYARTMLCFNNFVAKDYHIDLFSRSFSPLKSLK